MVGNVHIFLNLFQNSTSAIILVVGDLPILLDLNSTGAIILVVGDMLINSEALVVTFLISGI